MVSEGSMIVRLVWMLDHDMTKVSKGLQWSKVGTSGPNRDCKEDVFDLYSPRQLHFSIQFVGTGHS